MTQKIRGADIHVVIDTQDYFLAKRKRIELSPLVRKLIHNYFQTQKGDDKLAQLEDAENNLIALKERLEEEQNDLAMQEAVIQSMKDEMKKDYLKRTELQQKAFQNEDLLKEALN